MNLRIFHIVHYVIILLFISFQLNSDIHNSINIIIIKDYIVKTKADERLWVLNAHSCNDEWTDKVIGRVGFAPTKKHSNQLLLESDKDGFDESSFNNEVSVARSESLLGPLCMTSEGWYAVGLRGPLEPVHLGLG